MTSPDALLAERLARVFDFLWIDLEHSALDLRDVQMLTVAIQAGGAFALVRLPRADSESLTAVLDMGIDGVVAPRIADASEAREFASSLRYPPEGSRGYAPRRRNPRQRQHNGHLTSSVACLVQIETEDALSDVDAIVAVDGLHGVVVGASDLALEIGVGLNPEGEGLHQATTRVAAAANGGGVAWGLAVAQVPDWLQREPHDRPRLMVLGSDTRLYLDGVDVALTTLDNLISHAR